MALNQAQFQITTTALEYGLNSVWKHAALTTSASQLQLQDIKLYVYAMLVFVYQASCYECEFGSEPYNEQIRVSLKARLYNATTCLIPDLTRKAGFQYKVFHLNLPGRSTYTSNPITDRFCIAKLTEEPSNVSVLSLIEIIHFLSQLSYCVKTYGDFGAPGQQSNSQIRANTLYPGAIAYSGFYNLCDSSVI